MLEVPSLASTAPEDCNNCYAEACLPSESPQHGRACWVGGWGTTRSGGFVSNKQKEVGVNVLSDEYCLNNTYYEQVDIDFDAEFCAGIPDKNGHKYTRLNWSCPSNSNLENKISPAIWAIRNYPPHFRVQNQGLNDHLPL